MHCLAAIEMVEVLTPLSLVGRQGSREQLCRKGEVDPEPPVETGVVHSTAVVVQTSVSTMVSGVKKLV